MKPILEDIKCLRCQDNPENHDREAVQMVCDKTRVVWCAAGHITVYSGQMGYAKITEVNDWEETPQRVQA